MGSLQLQEITISYGGKPIIEKLSLDVGDGELFSLLGPSGVGKTTLLKTIAGLIPPKSGTIFINGIDVTKIPAEKRDAVLIFQQPLLFPFLDVGDNIGFGLKMSRVGRNETEQRVKSILALTGLQGLKDRKVHQLSGGQQQRVALARGLVLEPSILLLDEPFSNLDAELRLRMRELIQEVQRQTGTTMLFVTHDQVEALSISHRVCLLLGGTVRQTGSPEELFNRPVDREVASFFGCDNLIAGAIKNNCFASKYLSCQINLKDCKRCFASIRPEDIILSPAELQGGIPAKILDIRFEGSTSRINVVTGGQTFTVLSKRLKYHAGQNVWLQFPLERLHFITEFCKV